MSIIDTTNHLCCFMFCSLFFFCSQRAPVQEGHHYSSERPIPTSSDITPTTHRIPTRPFLSTLRLRLDLSGGEQARLVYIMW